MCYMMRIRLSLTVRLTNSATNEEIVIIVTMAYRLNIFGFFTTMDGESPGNFGLMDQAAALDWVKHNTAMFGGNQGNICIFGQGSGAVSVGLHLTSGVWSAKSFHKAIAMSGNSLAPNVVKIAKRETGTIDTIASAFGCFRKPTSALISCLRNVPSQALLDQGDPITEWGPIIDNGLSNTTRPFIPDYPIQLFEKGLYEKVPILSGYTNMEEALILIKDDGENAGISQSDFDSMITDLILIDIVIDDDNTTCYTNQQHIFDTVGFMFKPLPPTKNETILRNLFLDFYTEKKYGSPTYLLGQYMHPHAPVYVYRFDLKPISEPPNENIPGWVGVAHNFDLTFAWGLPYLALPQDIGKWQSSDKRVSDIIMKMWANFALYSNPTNSGVFITWEPFTTEEPHFLIINRTFNMSTALTINYKAFEFWNDFYPKVIEIGTQCCNETESSAVSLHLPAFSAVWLLAFVITPFTLVIITCKFEQ